MPDLSWRTIRGSYYDRQTFMAESGEFRFTLSQGQGPGFWKLVAEAAIPYDKAEMARWHSRLIEAEVADISGERNYDVSGLLNRPRTHKLIGELFPDMDSHPLNTEAAQDWAAQEATRIMSAHP